MTTIDEPVLEIIDLHVEADGNPILKGLDLAARAGEIHALMGPNGSGKSTLANTLLANPAYTVTRGRIRFLGEVIPALSADARASRGLFLGFQPSEAISPVAICNSRRKSVCGGVGVSNLSVDE